MSLTKREIKKLNKIKKKADKLQDKLDVLCQKAAEITKEPGMAGHTFDFVMNDRYTVKSLSRVLGL